MNVSSISQQECKPRRNNFIQYANSFMSAPESNENISVEEKQKINPLKEQKEDKTMGIETLTIFPKEIKDGKMIITA